MKKPLTSLLITNLKPAEIPYYVGDAKQDGLRVRVAQDGGRTWNVTVRIKRGKILSTSLGTCDPEGKNGLDLANARERAADIVKAARLGIDLIATERLKREAQEKLVTTADLIAVYSRDIASPNRRGGALRTAKEIERRLGRAMANSLAKPVHVVSRRDIAEHLDAVSAKYPREAEKRRQVVDAMFKWGVAKGYVTANPAAGLPSYGNGALRDRTLSRDELKKLWLWLEDGAANMPPDAVVVLKLQILLGARVGEVAGIKASEIWHEGEQLFWTLPAGRSKNKKAHTRPLVGRARSIVEDLIADESKGAFFQTVDKSRALRSDDIGLALNHRERPIEHFTTHDLRRTFVSGLDELGVTLETIAAAIGHQRGGNTTRTLVKHYSRPNLDIRIRDALMVWDSHITKILHS